MTFKELYKSFLPVADRLESEGATVRRIAAVFNSYVNAKVNYEKYEQDRQTTLKDADALFGEWWG